MPSLIKSLSVAVVAGCLSGQIGWETCAQAQTNKASSSVKGYQPSTSAAGKTAPRGTAEKSTSRGTTTPRVATVPPGRAPLNDQRPLPAAKPFRIPRLTPELEDILIEWEQKSAKITRLEGKFTRITYNSVFETELYAEGKFCFKYPDKGSLQQVGSKVAEGAKGKRYPAQSGNPQRWVCDGEKILQIDDKAKQYHEAAIPIEDRGQNIRKSPLPFLFGMKAEEAKLRYSFELVKERTNEHQIQLKVIPLLPHDLANYKMAEVLLDRKTCVPMAVKLYDNSGGKEDVYVFPKKDLTINNRNWVQWIGGDPLLPNLAGYKKAVNSEADGETPGTQLAPRPVDRRSTQAPAGTGKTLGSRTFPQRTAQLPDDDEPPARASIKGKSRP